MRKGASSLGWILGGLFAAALLAGAPTGAEQSGGIMAATNDDIGSQDLTPPLRMAESLQLAPFVELAAASLGSPRELEAMTAWNTSGALPSRSGFARRLPRPIELFPSDQLTSDDPIRPGQGAQLRMPDGSRVWGTSIYVPNSYRLRAALSSLRLPLGTRMWVWGESEPPRRFGLELLGPDNLLWTPSVDGPTLYIEIQIPPEEAVKVDMPLGRLEEVLESFPLNQDGSPRTTFFDVIPEANTSCLINAACVTNDTIPGIDGWKRGVAHLRFVVSGNSYICTGDLLNNTNADATPYLLELLPNPVPRLG